MGIFDKLFRKEPIQPITMTEAEILAKVYEFHPDRTYVFWFEQAMNPSHIQILYKNLQARGITGTILCGLKAPKIFEFEEKPDGSVEVTTKPVNPSDTGEEGQS